MHLVRIGITAALAATLLVVALQVVPGATVGTELRMMAFVFAGPWLVAMLVVHPRRLAGAFAALFRGGTDEESVTVRVLELVGGLTVAAGATGSIGSYFCFYAAACQIEELKRAYVTGIVAAMVMPAAFALMVRLALFESVLWSLRRVSTPRTWSIVALRTIPTRWKVAAIVAATFVAIEGFRAVVLAPAEPIEESAPDVTFAVICAPPVYGPPAPAEQHAPSSIRIALVAEEAGLVCRIDEKLVVARPGPNAELYEQLCRRFEQSVPRRIKIDLTFESNCQDLVAVLDAVARSWFERAGTAKPAMVPELQLHVPTNESLPRVQRLRLVRLVGWNPNDPVVQVVKPIARSGAPIASAEAPSPAIFITYDPDTRHSEIVYDRMIVSLEEMSEAIGRPEIKGKSGSSRKSVRICGDREAPYRKLCEILVTLAQVKPPVTDVWLEVARPDD